MRLLIDTQILLWFVQNNKGLPTSIRSVIVDPDNDVAVSMATYWEIAIKQKNKPGDVPWEASVVALESLAVQQEIVTLPITTHAVEHTKQLTLIHRDPFDRIIAAAAVTSGMRLISSDVQMDHFVLDRIWI